METARYALYASRFIGFGTAMVLFGASAFRYYALDGDALASVARPAFGRWFGRVSLLTAILALVSAVALLLCQSAAMAGAPRAALDPATVAAALFETRFGRIWQFHL